MDMIEFVFLFLLGMIEHNPNQSAPAFMSPHRWEKYQWKFDGSQGFKVFVTIKEPYDSTTITLLDALEGWNCLRGDPVENDMRGEPLMSKDKGLSEWRLQFYRWHLEIPVVKPESIELAFWFHRSTDPTTKDGYSGKEILDTEDAAPIVLILNNMVLRVSGYNLNTLQKYKHYFDIEICGVRGCVGSSGYRNPFGTSVYFADWVNKDETLKSIRDIEGRYGIFKVTDIEYRSGYGNKPD